MSAVMVFRSARCTGCMNCVVACKQENRTGPGVNWLRIERHEKRAPDRITWQLGICVHCDSPACVAVCPSSALRKSAEGVVSVDAAACQPDCGVCLTACAYGALSLVPATGYFGTRQEREAACLDHQHHQPGKISLCTLCAHRGGDTACANACPTGALTVQGSGPVTSMRYAQPLATSGGPPLPSWNAPL